MKNILVFKLVELAACLASKNRKLENINPCKILISNLDFNNPVKMNLSLKKELITG